MAGKKQDAAPIPPKPIIGRPTSFTDAIGDLICDRISNGESLRAICSEESMPCKSTVFRWLSLDKVFSDQYARAKEEQAECLADEIVAISDEQETVVKTQGDGTTVVAFDATAVQRNKLRVDARKWVASKLKPKKYGDKLDLNVAGEIGVKAIPDDELDRRIAELAAKAGIIGPVAGEGAQDKPS